MIDYIVAFALLVLVAVFGALAHRAHAAELAAVQRKRNAQGRFEKVRP
jgi:hypothetical protein